MGISDPERVKVWVRSGGRCARCKTYLLESGITYKETLLGELAHNIGRSTGPKSPRGNDSLPLDQRDLAENIVLLCGSCHAEIDKLIQVEDLTVEKVAEIKQAHEAFIRHVTGLDQARTTVVVRVLGRVRGTAVELRQETAASAVLACAGRYPSFALAPDRQGIEIDLRQIPGEQTAGPDYYKAAAAAIDEALATRLRPATENDAVSHLSIFALARLPLLVYLGSRIDDTIATDVYQRHRDDETWVWHANSETVEFTHRLDQDGTGDDAVLIVNASGTIHSHEIPNEVSALPRFVIEPTTAVPGQDTVRTMATLRSFEQTVRSLFSQLESERKNVTRLHVFAAAPVSAAVMLGRSVGWGMHPALTMYDRVDQTYVFAMEVTAP